MAKGRSKTRYVSERPELRAQKRQADSIKALYQRNPKIKELLIAKKDGDSSSYEGDEAFVDSCLKFYQDGKEKPFSRASYVSSVKGVKRYLKKNNKEFCGDKIDRELVRDFTLISYKFPALGLNGDEKMETQTFDIWR